MARGPIVVNPWHWLAPDGSFPEDAKIRGRAIRVAQCIEYGGPLADGECRETLMSCRFRPGRKPCPGLLWVLKQRDEAILAFCAVCHGEEFLIYEWEDTPWAEGPMEPVHVADLARDAGEQRVEPREATAEDAPKLVVRALEVLGSSMRASEVVARIAVAPHPMAVLQAVVDGLPRPPTKGAIERFLPVLTEIWNATPRPELAGKSPTQVRRDTTDSAGAGAPKVGRNAPCPCGSGKKYKRCCWRKPSLH